MKRSFWLVAAGIFLSVAMAQENKSEPQKEAAKQASEKPAEQEKPPAASKGGPDFVIGPEDILDINVWREPEMSRTVPVRPDGKISLPLLGEFEAAGSTAKQLEAKLVAKLDAIVTNPQVTVIVRDIRSQKYSIMGEVGRPGSYPLSGQMTVLDAVAAAGGLKDFANPKKMYILRRLPNGNSQRIPVNYKAILNGDDGQNVMLQLRDTIVVP
jgi:polysaccharide export outer membrane protein